MVGKQRLKYGHFSNHYAGGKKLFHVNLHLELFVRSAMPPQHHQGAVIERGLGLKNMHVLVPAHCLSNI